MAQSCTTADLIAGGAPFEALNDHELRAIRVMLKAKTLNTQTPATPASLETLLSDSSDFRRPRFSEKQRLAILAFLSCREAVAVGAETGCDVAALLKEAKCWVCVSDEELAAIDLILSCAEVDTGDIAL
jgi:hypothetical protein